MGKRRRTEIVEITNPAARLVTYSKRRKGLFNKASELSRLCGARVAVVVFSPAGKPCSFGDPSADEIIADYLRDRDDDTMPPIGLTEWVERVGAELDACETEEELESCMQRYDAVRDYAQKMLMTLEADSQGKVVDGGDSHMLSDGEIDSVFKSFKDRCPALSALLSDGDACLPSLENLAASGGDLTVEPTPALSALSSDGDACLPLLENLVEPTPALLALSSDGACLPLLEDLAAGGGDLTVEPTPALSDLADHGFNPDDFLNLDGDGSGLVTSPEDSTGGNRGAEAMQSDLEGYIPNDFAALEDFEFLL